MTALFAQLKQLQQVAGVAEPNTSIISVSETADAWDDLAFDPVLAAADTSTFSSETTRPATHSTPNASNNIGPVPIEDQIIALCSNGNTSNAYRNLEIKHRTLIAGEQLNHIRNLIAEKSFQFSHVIRVSPRKAVTTRARAAVKKLNNQIAEHCRFYARCRSSLLLLQAGESILLQFRVLNPEDIVGSTAILKPNQPGSTKIKLSWIWQVSARNILLYAGQDPDDMADYHNTLADDLPSVLECKAFSFHFKTILKFVSSARSLVACPCTTYAMARRGHTNDLRNAMDGTILCLQKQILVRISKHAGHTGHTGQ